MSCVTDVPFFIKIDSKCERIPFVSTLTKSIILIQKAILNVCERQHASFERYSKVSIKPDFCGHDRDCCPFFSEKYATHLKEKGIVRAVVLLLPIVGNLVIKLYDMEQIRKVKRGEEVALEKIPAEYQNDEEFVANALKGNPKLILQVSSRLLDSDTFYDKIKSHTGFNSILHQHLSKRLKLAHPIQVPLPVWQPRGPLLWGYYVLQWLPDSYTFCPWQSGQNELQVAWCWLRKNLKHKGSSLEYMVKLRPGYINSEGTKKQIKDNEQANGWETHRITISHTPGPKDSFGTYRVSNPPPPIEEA